jgi:hypothetical protein
MIFAVEAWFHDAAPEQVFSLLCESLTCAGFAGVDRLTPQTSSWDYVAFAQQKVFVSHRPQTEDHLAITVQAPFSWDAGASAFQKVFLYLLHHRLNPPIAELLLSVRNPEPYPFLTHSFMRGSMPPTMVNLDQNCVTQRGESSYWNVHGPQLHFIAHEVFERTQVSINRLADRLAAAVLPLEGGVILDCGWTNEFSLPELPTPIKSNPIDLAAQGIDLEQAETLRTNLATFSEDWNSPEMSIYDDYDAALKNML